MPPTRGPSRSPELVDSLSAALGGSADALWSWYRALATASPFWARQQLAYETAFQTPQTTEFRGPTAWRVMSHAVEQESPAGTPLGNDRLYLEFTSRIDSPAEMTPSTLGRVYRDVQLPQDLAKVVATQQAPKEFFEAGASKKQLPAARRRTYGATHPGPRGVIPPEHVGALVRDARDWLLAVRSCLGTLGAGASSRRALPFLDGAEIRYVLSVEAQKSWRIAAACLVQRRLSAFPNGNVGLGTIFGYAFGNAEAHRASGRIALLRRNPVQPDPPPYPG